MPIHEVPEEQHEARASADSGDEDEKVQEAFEQNRGESSSKARAIKQTIFSSSANTEGNQEK